MKHDITKMPPAYAPNAVAKPNGWTDPVTGELLVAIKLDVDAIKASKKPKAQPTVAPTPTQAVEVATEAPTEVVTEAPVEVLAQPERKRGAK